MSEGKLGGGANIHIYVYVQTFDLYVFIVRN